MRCIACKDTYHYSCLNITTAQFMAVANKAALEVYKCGDCNRVNTARRRVRDDETPVISNMQDSLLLDMSCDGLHSDAHNETTQQLTRTNSAGTSQALDNTPITLGTLKVTLQEMLAQHGSSMMEAYSEKFQKLIKNIKQEFTETIAQVNSNVAVLSSKVESLTSRLAKLEQDNVQLQQEIVATKQQVNASDADGLHNAISQLRQELNEREQSTLLNDVEISGVPEYEAESSGHLVTVIAAKLGVTLQQQDIVSARRVGPRRLQTADSSLNVRPRPIVVCLARRALRDDLLKSARIRRGTTTADLGLPKHEPHRLFLNERLTKANRALFGAARENARRLSYRFSWTKEGRVFVRRDESSPIVQLRSEKDLKSCFTI